MALNPFTDLKKPAKERNVLVCMVSAKKNRRITRIKANVGWRDIDLAEVFEYRDLIKMLVKRYFSTIYKQTVLGPLWIALNPIITTLMYSLVFGYIASISTDGIPYLLFYMSGTTMWGLFSSCLTSASNTFVSNAGLFSKVYFPRLTAPIASTICACVNYFIQFTIFLAVFFYYFFTQNILFPNTALFLVPVLILQTSVLGMSLGIIIASWTVRYRDLGVLISFAIQLWMYVTPVVYPISAAGSRMRIILMLNPMSPVMEAFRYAFTGIGDFSLFFLSVSAFVTAVLLIAAVLLFNHAEKTCVDTI